MCEVVIVDLRILKFMVVGGLGTLVNEEVFIS